MQGTVFDIQRFSTHDGEGIRTTVFLKGCNNRCVWCHNPESLSSKPQLRFFASKCIGCMRCVEVCKYGALTSENFDILKCVNCGECAKVCCTGAREVTGKSMSALDLFRQIKKDKSYYQNSGGGVTFSGGEPMLQADFIKEVSEMCSAESISVGIQTAGNVPYSEFEKIIQYTDFIMCDLKVFNDDIHKKYTGVSNSLILENIRRLAEEDMDLIIRTPVITGVNDNKEYIADICRYIKDFKNLKYYELLKYNELGVSKLEEINPVGYDYMVFEPVQVETMKILKDAANQIIKNVKCNAVNE